MNQFRIRELGSLPLSGNEVDILGLVLCSDNVTEEQKQNDKNVYDSFVLFPTRKKNGDFTVNQSTLPNQIYFRCETNLKTEFILQDKEFSCDEYFVLKKGTLCKEKEDLLESWSKRPKIPDKYNDLLMCYNQSEKTLPVKVLESFDDQT